MKIFVYVGLICCLAQGNLYTGQNINQANGVVQQYFDFRFKAEEDNNDDGNYIQMSPQVSGELMIPANNSMRGVLVGDIFAQGDNSQVQDIFVGLHEPDYTTMEVADDAIDRFYRNNEGNQEFNTSQSEDKKMIFIGQAEDELVQATPHFVDIFNENPNFTINRKDNSNRDQNKTINRDKSSIEVEQGFNDDNIKKFTKVCQDSHSLVVVGNNENNQEYVNYEQANALQNKEEQVTVDYDDQIVSSHAINDSEEQVQTSCDPMGSKDEGFEVGQKLKHENASVDFEAAKGSLSISDGRVCANDTYSSMEHQKNNNASDNKSDNSLPEPKAKFFCGWC